MSKQLGATAALFGGIRATVASLPVLIPVALATGVVLAVADHAVLGAFRSTGHEDLVARIVANDPRLDQRDMIAVLLSMEGMGMLFEVVAGPLVAAVAVYVGRLWSHGQPRQLYGAVNFALNRYRKLFLPRAAAQLSIQIGMMVVVPGILFLQQYAFVDAVACLEQEAWPLSRSKKLTRGSRGRIFRIFLPYLVLTQGYILLDVWALQNGFLMLTLVHAAEVLVSISMLLAFYLLYEARITPAGQGVLAEG